MSVPANVTLVGTFDGYSGVVRVTRSVWLRSSVDDSMVPPKRYTATLDGSGHVEITVPSCADPDWTPQDYTVRLTIALTGVAPDAYDVVLPMSDDPIEIADLLPAASSAGTMFAPLAHTHTFPEPDLSGLAPADHAHAAYLPKLAPVITDSTLTVEKDDGSSAIRMRATGGAVDYDIRGDIVVGSWSGVDFTGTQTGIQRWRGDGTTLAGRTNFGTGVYADENFIEPGVRAALGGRNAATPVILVGYLAGSGTPNGGYFDAGEVILRDNGWYRCSVSGDPGTWVAL